MQVDGLLCPAFEPGDTFAQSVEVQGEAAIRSGRRGPHAVGRFQFDRAKLAILLATQCQQLVACYHAQVTGRLPLVAFAEICPRQGEERLLREVVSLGRVGTQEPHIPPDARLVAADQGG
jgi:hypothetical protein